MRDLFRGYYRPTEEQFKSLWENGIFVFDTNVLLSLYSYPDEVRTVFLSVLDKVADRIWIPYQVALEFHRNKLPGIKRANQRVLDLLKTIKKSEAELTKEVQEIELEKRNIGVTDLPERLAAVKSAHQSLLAAVQLACDKLPSLSLDDPIGESLARLLQGRVGQPPSDQQALDDALKDAQERYDKKIPPGFSDSGKGGESYRDRGIDYQSKFGDLLLWKQMISHAKGSSITQMIFITSDKKEDWWRLDGTNIIGPRPELIHEIFDEAGTDVFWMYSADQFLKYAENYLKATEVTQHAIEQVREATAQSNPWLQTGLVGSDFERFKQGSIFDDMLDKHWSPDQHAKFARLMRSTNLSTGRRISTSGEIENWLATINSDCTIRETFEFPDFIVESGDQRFGYEITQLTSLTEQSLNRLTPVLVRGSESLLEGDLDEMYVVVSVPFEDYIELSLNTEAAKAFRRRATQHVKNLLDLYPITAVIIGSTHNNAFDERLRIYWKG